MPSIPCCLWIPRKKLGTSKAETVYPPSMNVLSEEKKQQAIALGRLGWSLRRIQCATRIRRETAAGYLKAAGIPVRPPAQWGRQQPQVSARQGTGNHLPGTDQ